MVKGSTKSKQADDDSGDARQDDSYQPAPEFTEDQDVEKIPRHHRIWRWYKNHKKVSIPLTALALLVVVASVPLTRFVIAGTVIKRNYSVKVVDRQNGKPVSSASVTLGGESAKTDNKGVATLKVKVGSTKVTVEKKYFKSASLDTTVPILKQKTIPEIKLEATGRQVPITVIDKITRKPVANARLVALGAEAKTDAKGQAILVLPADKTQVAATISATKYNKSEQSIRVTTDAVAENTIGLTPSGKIYFLSNATGTIDVIKSNLDGSARQTVLAGTGKEDRYSTVLLASRDWKYLALYSKRDGGNNAKIFLIDATNGDKVTTMDEGNASFQLVGWQDHRFVYQVNRTSLNQWDAKRQAIKSYNAEANQLTTLDETVAEPGSNPNQYFVQNFSDIYIIEGRVVYAVTWVGDNGAYGISSWGAGKYNVIRSVEPSGQGKKDNKIAPVHTAVYVSSNVYELNSVVFAYPVPKSSGYTFYEYEDNDIKTISIEQNDFFNATYATHLLSPSGSKTLWSESRDGKNSVFIGDKGGFAGKQLLSQANTAVFGWYTDNYVLISKDSSELYIVPASELKAGQQPVKISDYYKPDYSIRGYGGGYGGL